MFIVNMMTIPRVEVPSQSKLILCFLGILKSCVLIFTHFKEIGWRRKWQPTPVFLPGKVHGQRNLAGCSPWGYMTEHVCTRVEGDGLVAIKW